MYELVVVALPKWKDLQIKVLMRTLSCFIVLLPL